MNTAWVIYYVQKAAMSAENSGQNLRQGISTREAQLLSSLAARGNQLVTIDDVETALGVPRNTAREVASRLAEKGWLDRIVPGEYLIVPLAAGPESVYTAHEYLIASRLADPMYVGYFTALSHHGLTEQVPRTVYVATPTRARSREIHGVQYRVVTLDERKFFGFDPVSVEGATVNVADLEKTLVDGADHPEYAGGIRALAEAMVTADEQGCDWGTVTEYLTRLDNGAATKRIAFLADHLDVSLPGRGALVESFTSGYSLLDPTRGDHGRYESDYRLRINLDLLSKIGTPAG